MSGRRLEPSAGVSLLELTVVLVVAGLMIVIAVATVPRLTERARLETIRDVTMEEVEQVLVEFAAANDRLPCPDTSATPNGLEGSGGTSACAGAPSDTVGLVPYRVLGFPDPILDEAHLPVRYAVYRNSSAGSADADLASLTGRFIPVLPGDPATVDFPVDGGGGFDADSDNVSQGLNPTRKMPDHQNDLDFCLALRNAKAAVASTSFVHTLDLTGVTPSFNAAFVLVSGGVEDADGSGLDIAFDGANIDVAPLDELGFESPARRRGVGYDDLVLAMPFARLESKLSCAAITVGVNAAATVANAAAHMVVQSEDKIWLAHRNTKMDDLTVAIAGLALTVAILRSIQIITDGVAASFGAACTVTSPTAAPAIGPIIAASVANLGIVVAAGFALAKAVATQSNNDDVLTGALSKAVVTNGIAARVCIDAVNVDQRAGQGNAPATPPSPPDRP